MAETTGILEKVAQELNLNRILRYGYGGLLILIFSTLIKPDTVKTIIDSLGVIIAPFAVLGLGTAFYIIHRYVLGELLMYPIMHHMHDLVDKKQGRTGLGSTSTVTYLKAIGVNNEDKRSAYIASRKQLFDQDIRNNLDISHAELHVLYITFEITFLFAIYLWYSKTQSHILPNIFQPISLMFTSIIVYISATIADIRQHQFECHLLKIQDREGKLKPFLQSLGYLKQ
jgi:hypothetical protein